MSNAATATEKVPVKTTVQPWRTASHREAFLYDNDPGSRTMSGALVSKLPTFDMVTGAPVSVCGHKFGIFTEDRVDNRDGSKSSCVAEGMLVIKNSPVHFHGDTAELYMPFDVGEDSSMVVGNHWVRLAPGMVVLLPPGEHNQHGAFGNLRTLMLFTPGLAKKKADASVPNPQRDEQETGVMARERAAQLSELSVGPEGITTEGGIVVAQIPPHFFNGQNGNAAQFKPPFERSIPGLHVKAMTVKSGDAPLFIQDHPGVTKIYVVLSGEGQLFAGDKVHTVEKDSTMLILPGVQNGLVSNHGSMNVLVAYLAGDREIVPEGFERQLTGFTRARIEQVLLAS